MRRKQTWLVQLFFIAVLLCGGCASQQHAFVSPSPISFRLGLCEDYPEETRTLASARADLLALKTNHISVLRVAMGWDDIEPRRGEYDWRFWDSFVASANELGIELIPYVCYTPDWAARTNHEVWKQPPRDAADFGRFMEKTATRYRGRVHSWEIWNEPDNSDYWAGTVEEFAELTRVGSAAVRKADPSAKIVSGGIAWNINFLDQLIEQPGVLEAIDVVNLHNYFETWSPDPVENIDNYVNGVKRLLSAAGTSKEIWLAEIGYSSFRRGAEISKAYNATYRYEHTPQFQAATVFRMLIPILESRDVSTAAWFRINDLPETEKVIGDVNNRHLGILTTNRSPKPALDAIAFFQKIFGNGVAPADTVIRVNSSLQSDAETHAFINQRGELVIATWLKVITPHMPFSADGNAIDLREERLRFEIPKRFRNEIRIYDATGHELRNRAKTERGKQAVEVTVRGGEVLVLVAGKPSPEK